MHIKIDVQLEPGEIDLATELLSTLRAFTDHVQVRRAPGEPLQNSAGGSTPASGNSTATEVASSPSWAASQTNGTGTSARTAQSTAGPPVPLPTKSAAAAPRPAAANDQQRTLPYFASAAAAEATAAPGKAAPQADTEAPRNLSRQELVQALRHLLLQLEEPPDTPEQSPSDKVTTQLALILKSGNLGTEQEAIDKFVEAFMSILSDPTMVQNEKSIVPYMYLLPRLPEPFLARMREPIIGKVVKHLTLARPVDANRAEIIAQAEAFACLVSLEFVSVQGAVNTLCTLLRDEKKRCAAVTMLGKTAEHCLQQLKADCPDADLARLRRELDALREPHFVYDQKYIRECMGWDDDGGADAVGAKFGGAAQLQPPPPQPQHPAPGAAAGLELKASFAGHEAGIFALAWEPALRQLASSSKDGKLMLWSAGGRALCSLDAPKGYSYNGLALADGGAGVLAAIGLCPPPALGAQAPPPCIEAFGARKGGLDARSRVSRTPANLISSLAFLPSTTRIVVGERHGDSGVVSVYDVNALGSNGEASPLSTLKGAQDLVTAVACMGGTGGQVALSGGRDGCIALWDARSGAQVATLAHRFGGPMPDNGAMVTTIDSHEHYVLAGSLDGYMSKWDLRAARQGSSTTPQDSVSLDTSAVLRCALGPRPGWAAVATLDGMYYMDPVDASQAPSEHQVVRFAPAGASVGPKNYADVKWGADKEVLYAAGAGMVVDVYTLT